MTDAQITAERDHWRQVARSTEGRLRAERSARKDILAELAQHVVVALRGAGYVQINPSGIPATNEQETPT